MTFEKCSTCGQRIYPQQSSSVKHAGQWYFGDQCKFIRWIQKKGKKPDRQRQTRNTKPFYLLPFVLFLDTKSCIRFALTCNQFHNDLWTSYSNLNLLGRMWWKSFLIRFQHRISQETWQQQIDIPGHREIDPIQGKKITFQYHEAVQQWNVPLLLQQLVGCAHPPRIYLNWKSEPRIQMFITNESGTSTFIGCVYLLKPVYSWNLQKCVWRRGQKEYDLWFKCREMCHFFHKITGQVKKEKNPEQRKRKSPSTTMTKKNPDDPLYNRPIAAFIQQEGHRIRD